MDPAATHSSVFRLLDEPQAPAPAGGGPVRRASTSAHLVAAVGRIEPQYRHLGGRIRRLRRRSDKAENFERPLMGIFRLGAQGTMAIIVAAVQLARRCTDEASAEKRSPGAHD